MKSQNPALRIMYIMFNSLLPDPCFACHGPGPILTPSLIVLSAANLGRLVRQLVAIDALSYVRSQ